MRARYMTTFLTSATLLLGLAWLAPPALEASAAKLQVCHIPAGNPRNSHTLTISEKTLETHLAHGDQVGNCSASPEVVSAAAPAGGTLDTRFYDFFTTRPGEYFDRRAAVYGETPIGANCFTASGLANGICSIVDATIPDVASAPFTIWSYKNESPGRKQIFTPFKFEIEGVDILGYDLTDPVFLPVLNSSEPAGTYLNFTWTAKFLDTATLAEIEAVPYPNCTNPGLGDGYYQWWVIELEMDLQQSRRIFGVVAADAAAAQTWWDNNTDPRCGGPAPSSGPVEDAMWDWFLETGGGQQANKSGTYDIMNAYGWFLDQVFLDIRATVDPITGITSVTIQHEAWGTSNLLNRFFYWGNAHYQDHYLDSSKALGWQGWEPSAWYDDMVWKGTLNAGDIDFTFTGVMMYDFELFALPGPDGNLDQVDDIPIWAWRPHLHDAGYYYGHTESELDRYIGLTETEAGPGSPTYGQVRPNVFVPTTWDLFDGETLSFEFPTGNVPFYDPNLTPIGSSGRSNDHVVISAPLSLHRTHPAGYGDWDPVLKTWTIVGPTVTGGSVGIPGDYPTEPFGAIYFTAVPEPGTTIGLAAGSALLAMMYRRRSGSV